MIADPVEAATALARLVVAQAHFRDAQTQRRDAVVSAVRAGAPLRAVAEAADCSHESVRRIVAADGMVTIELGGNEYQLSQQTVDLLVYKLAGYAACAFPRDVQLLGAGSDWLPAAGELADALQSAMADEEDASVHLDEPKAHALHQVLRLTQMTIPSTLSRLADELAKSDATAGGSPDDPTVPRHGRV
jgi:hypothetical protein